MSNIVKEVLAANKIYHERIVFCAVSQMVSRFSNHRLVVAS